MEPDDPHQISRGTGSAGPQAESPLPQERGEAAQRRRGVSPSTVIREFLLAIQFFTRIPITGRLADWVGYSPQMLRASAAHFTGVGWVVGVPTAALFASVWWWLPAQPAAPWVAALVSTVFSVMLTGGFHEDGLADLADGLGGSSRRERALEIMKDSRIGSFGAMALVLALLGKVSVLALIAQSGGAAVAAVALFAGHVTSRLMPLFVIHTLPHVGDTPQSKSKPLAESIGKGALAVGVIWWLLAMALVMVLLPTVRWAQAVVGALLALGWMWLLLRRRLQGFTGDGLGATQQLCEIAFLLALAVSLPAPAP